MLEDSSKRRLPLAQAIIYASGYFGVALIGFAIGQIPQLYYIPVEGVALIAPVTILGSILVGGYIFGLLNALGRIIDGVVDPWMGNISDHFRSRFGRRKPFMVVGAPMMAVFLVLFTLPPSTEPSYLNIIWLAIIYPLFFLFFTIAITPYLAMIPEITRTSADRLLVTTIQAVFLVLGTFTGVAFIQKKKKKISFTLGAILIGILTMIPFLLVSALVRIPDEVEPSDISERPSTFRQIRSALAFAPFRIYLIAQVAFWFGFKMIETSAKYIAVHLVGNREAFLLILGTALGMATVFGAASYWLGRKLGKKRSMILMSIIFIVLLPLVGLIGKGILSSWAAIAALFGLLGLPLSLLLIIPNSLLADIIDRDYEQSGEKREALFFASQALLNKIGIAFSKTALNFLLPIGAVATAEGMEAVGETGVRLVGPVAGFFMLIGLLVFVRLPDIEKR